MHLIHQCKTSSMVIVANNENRNVMKKYYSLFLILIFACSCTNESVVVPEQNQELILKRVNFPLVDAENDCPGRFAEFDSHGKIIEVYYECDGNLNTIRSYTYNENSFIKYFTGFYDFEYDENDNLIKRSGGNDTGGGYHDFTYTDNSMHLQGYYRGEQNSYYTVYTFEDSSFTKMLGVETFDTSGANEEVISRITYQYSANNPIEILFEQKGPDDVAIELKRSITITYDDKINPYKQGLPENAYLASETFMAYTVQFYNIMYSADNNHISIIENNFETNIIYTITNVYDYNDDMYPVQAVLSYNGEPFRKEIFEYYE